MRRELSIPMSSQLPGREKERGADRHTMPARKPSRYTTDAPPIAPRAETEEPAPRGLRRIDDFAPFALVTILAVVLLWLWLHPA